MYTFVFWKELVQHTKLELESTALDEEPAQPVDAMTPNPEPEPAEAAAEEAVPDDDDEEEEEEEEVGAAARHFGQHLEDPDAIPPEAYTDGRALFCLSGENSIRRACATVVAHKAFDHAILFFIGFNSVHSLAQLIH